MHIGTQVGLGPGDIVIDGDTAPPPQRDTAPNFWPMSIYGQRAVCSRIPLGMEVGLSLGDIVFDRDRDPPPVMGHSPQFSPMSILAKRLDGLRCHLVWR